MKPCPKRKWIAFLKSQGLEYKRTTRHEIWDTKDNSLPRPVTFRPTDKDIPTLHIHTNLITLGMSHAEFNEIIKKL
jgi:hypothetical protein